jgi:N-methylhydantoinase B/oxoprolinase/acetone carboxylase alpha subunit
VRHSIWADLTVSTPTFHRATVQILAIVASRAHRAHALLSHLLA